MHEDLNQKISQFLDDELSQAEALSLLKKMRIDSELADKMRRYEAVSHAIKNDDILVAAKPDFVSSVSKMLESEATYLIPKAERRMLHRVPRFSRQKKIAAAAASVAVIAFVAQTTQRPKPAGDAVVVAAKPAVNIGQPQQAAAAPRDYYPINRQMSDYLQAHNSLYAKGQVDFRPYAQVTHYSQK